MNALALAFDSLKEQRQVKNVTDDQGHDHQVQGTDYYIVLLNLNVAALFQLII